MLEIIEIIFPYFLLLYFVESIKFLKNGIQSLVAPLRGSYLLKENSIDFSNISPLNHPLSIDSIPILFSNNGIYFPDKEEAAKPEFWTKESFTFINYKDIKKVENYWKDLIVNKTTILRCSSATKAEFIVKKIKEVLNSDDKKSLIKTFSKSQTVDLLDKQMAKVKYSIKLLTFINISLFLLSFVIIPIFTYTDYNIVKTVKIDNIMIVLSALYLMSVIISFITHKKAFPSQLKHRIIFLLSLLAAPASSINSASHITKDIFYKFDSEVILSKFMPVKHFLIMARLQIYTAKRLAKTGNDDWKSIWLAKEKVIKNILSTKDISENELWKKPEKESEESSHYCPVCHSQYSKYGEGNCYECSSSLSEFST